MDKLTIPNTTSSIAMSMRNCLSTQRSEPGKWMHNFMYLSVSCALCLFNISCNRLKWNAARSKAIASHSSRWWKCFVWFIIYTSTARTLNITSTNSSLFFLVLFASACVLCCLISCVVSSARNAITYRIRPSAKAAVELPLSAITPSHLNRKMDVRVKC